MTTKDKGFYEELGQRITELRKAQGLTQVELSKILGVAQQTLANYEGGSARIPAARLPRMAEVLGVSVEELIGTGSRPGKRGPAPKFQQQLERVSRLPRAKQRVVNDIIEGYLRQAS